MIRTKIIVLDDDPTGCQTVHGCLLLTRWDPGTLREALMDSAPLFFVLTNTRGMSATEAAQTTRQVCTNLRTALDSLDQVGIVIHPVLVSRSDSTLRGHYPVETDVIGQELGPFDAHFMVPAFFEGGRTTRAGVHYLRVADKDVPVHETEFARDSVFAYQHSYLPDYVAEKTQGRIRAEQVQLFSLDDVRGDIGNRLLALSGNVCCAVDAEKQSDLDNFARQILLAAQRGKRFLFRSAASLLTSLAALPPQTVAATDMHRFVRNNQPGVVVIGSHVAKTTQQLRELLKQPGVAAIEVDVDRVTTDRDALLTETLRAVEQAFGRRLSPIIFTSRSERQFSDHGTRLEFGQAVSLLLMNIVQHLPTDIGFLISKGGITSNDTLSTGLALRTARLLGQILPGVSVIACPPEHPRYPGLPVVIFPGNVGDEFALATAYARLSTNTVARAARSGVVG